MEEILTARKLVDGKRRSTKFRKIAVCEGSLAGDGILVGDEEACWPPVTKRKNNKSQSSQSGVHVRSKKDKTSAQNDVLRELGQIRAQMWSCVKKRRTGGKMVLWKRRPEVCFE